VASRGGIPHVRVLPLATALGVNGAAVAALEDMATLVASAVGVNEGESTFNVFFWLKGMLVTRAAQHENIREKPSFSYETATDF